MDVHDFAPISSLLPNTNAVSTLGVAWNDSTQPINIELLWNEGKAKVSLRAPVGELVRAVIMPVWMFQSEQGKLC